jgi:6-phospho-3-hexuloisomerase
LDYLKTIIKEIDQVTSQMNEDVLVSVSQELAAAPRIFVVGEGRSGFMAKAFAMRLMHLGATVFVVGETITPAIASGDLVVTISGSGKTKSVIDVAAKVQKLGGKVIAFTANPDSELSEHSTTIVHIPAATKYRKDGEPDTIQPLGSLFDQSTHIVCDTLCLLYAEQKNEDNDTAFSRHSNVE